MLFDVELFPLRFNEFVAGDDDNGDDGVLSFPFVSAGNLVCFSWHSFTEFSKSFSRCRSQSTVKLSTVS